MTSAQDQAVLSVLDDMYQAWVEGDADAFVARWAKDATSILPRGFRQDREAARAATAADFAGPLKGSTVRDEVQSVRHYGKDTAIVISRSGVVSAGETEPPAWVLATWVLTRQDGEWRLAAYHNCPA